MEYKRGFFVGGILKTVFCFLVVFHMCSRFCSLFLCIVFVAPDRRTRLEQTVSSAVRCYFPWERERERACAQRCKHLSSVALDSFPF